MVLAQIHIRRQHKASREDTRDHLHDHFVWEPRTRTLGYVCVFAAVDPDVAVDPFVHYLNIDGASIITTTAELEGPLHKADAKRSTAVKEAVGAIKIADAQKKHASSWKEMAMDAQMTKWNAQAEAIE